jgi:hypothetical protein
LGSIAALFSAEGEDGRSSVRLLFKVVESGNQGREGVGA